MKELSPSIFRIEPSKITPSKYISFFVKRESGNLLFPCVSSSSTFENDWPEIQQVGGVHLMLLGDMHFATKHIDQLTEEFGVVVKCSELEEPDVSRKVKDVESFPFKKQLLEEGITALPTPGHRPGAMGYLVVLPDQSALFIGDSIWHNGKEWQALTSKANRPTMIRTLQELEEVQFDSLYCNVSVTNNTCSVSFESNSERKEFLRLLADALS